MSPENGEKPVKILVFWDYLGNGSNDFNKKLHEDRGERYGVVSENRTSKSLPVPEIFEVKVRSGGPRPWSEPGK